MNQDLVEKIIGIEAKYYPLIEVLEEKRNIDKNTKWSSISNKSDKVYNPKKYFSQNI